MAVARTRSLIHRLGLRWWRGCGVEFILLLGEAAALAGFCKQEVQQTGGCEETEENPLQAVREVVAGLELGQRDGVEHARLVTDKL